MASDFAVFLMPVKNFFGSCNAIFGRVGRFASEEVILHLIRTKCLPVLLYAIEACPLLSRDVHSFEFVINRCLMKLFKTSSIVIVNECCDFFWLYANTIDY